MNRSHTYVVLSLLLVSSIAPAARADDSGPEEAGSHHAAGRHAAVFYGTARVAGHYYHALGADAEMRLPIAHDRVGVAAAADAVFGEHVHLLVGAGLALHPFGGLKLTALPAAGFEEGHRSFVFRAGVGYDVHVGSLSVTPVLNVDVADGHASHVFGIAMGLGF